MAAILDEQTFTAGTVYRGPVSKDANGAGREQKKKRISDLPTLIFFGMLPEPHNFFLWP